MRDQVLGRDVAGDDLTLIAYGAESGSPSEEALRLLASWTATNPTAPALEEPQPRP